MDLDYKLISNVSLEDVDYNDYPDMCDAFVKSADYDGEPMTEEMLDFINDDRNLIHELLFDYLN